MRKIKRSGTKKEILIPKTESEKETLKTFYQLVVDIKNSQEAEKILTCLLLKSEISLIAKRLKILKLLSQKISYSQIKKETGVSSATISSLAKLLKERGVHLALRKLKAEEWAEKWEKRIKSLFKRS